MDQKGNKEDDFFSIICGDLGLGESTRSANFLKFDTNSQVEPNSYRTQNDSVLSEQGVANEPRTKCSYKFPPSTIEKNLVEIGDSDGSLESEYFPMYADVPYGTSLKQQKKLYEKQINNLRKHFTLNQTDGTKQTRKSIAESKKDNQDRLLVALQEMDELKIELDACRKRLDAKYKAVAILRQQVENADTELKNTEKKASETSRKLEQHGDGMNALVQALDAKEVARYSREMLELELERVCQENSSLTLKLEGRNEELRRANAHKSALARERDELLALLDVTERQKYEHGRSRTAEEDYETFSSSELAVLGACKCRVTSPDPCGCAHAAANLRKEVSKLKDELSCITQRREEANLTVDAYRAAFEEQLAKSRSMSIKLSQLATISSRSAKARAAIKWLIQVLNDDDYSPPKPIETAVDSEKGQTITTMSLQELVTLLTEMVIEKNEVLAHNKLASQVLANKLLKYEQKDNEKAKDSQFKLKDGKSKSSTSKLAPNYKLHMYLKQPNTYSSIELSEDVKDMNDQGENEDVSTLEGSKDQCECVDSIDNPEECCSPTDSNNRSVDCGASSALAMNEIIDEVKSDLLKAEIHQNEKSSQLKEQDFQDDYNNNDAELMKCIQMDGHLNIAGTDENVNNSDESKESDRSNNQNECNLEQKHPEKSTQKETVNGIISEEKIELDIGEK